MTGISSSSPVFFKKRATSKVMASSSITQGPAIKNSEPSARMVKLPIFITGFIAKRYW